MKYCEDDLPVKIVFANDLLKFFGDALVAMLNEENPPAIPSSVREMLTECAELGGLELLYQEVVDLIDEYRRSK